MPKKPDDSREYRSIIYTYAASDRGSKLKQDEVDALCKDSWVVEEQKATPHSEKREHLDEWERGTGISAQRREKPIKITTETSYVTVSIVLSKPKF